MATDREVDQQSTLPSSTERTVAVRFKERFELAHAQKRPLILDWELANEIERTLTELERLRSALRNIATNKLTSTTVLGSLYAAGVNAGLAIAADMARKALENGTSNSLEHVRQSPLGSVPAIGAPTAPAAPCPVCHTTDGHHGFGCPV